MLLATGIGAVSGIGGGIIIKPVLDLFNDFNASAINILSTASVFVMSVVSIIRQIGLKTKLKLSVAVFMGIGAIFGGLTGQNLLSFTESIFVNESKITIIQNVILIFIIIISLWYIKNESKIQSKNYSGIVSSVLTGFILGIVSSFLGIGGGPVNIAVIMYCFSFDIKISAVYSIITIFFSQGAKLLIIAGNSGFAGHDLSVLPLMVTGAVLGGFIGSTLNKKLPDKNIKFFYIASQIFVIVLAFINIIRNL